MRIEIMIGVENPVYYPINKPKIIIGSDLAADIVVSEDQISRKHLIIVQEGDQFFVIDQGSTNGSYLNEERLVPGRKTEFTSYFPVRLGSSVLVSLVTDQEAEDDEKISIPFPGDSSKPKKNPLVAQSSGDRTTVISLKDLQNTRTDSLVKKRQEYKKKVSERSAKEEPGKKKAKKKKSPIKPIHIVVALILLPALYFTFIGKEAPPVVVEVKPPTVEEKVAVAKTQGVLIDPVPKEKIMQAFSASKCQSAIEKDLCANVKGSEIENWGAVSVDEERLVVISNATAFYEEAKTLLPPPVATETVATEAAATATSGPVAVSLTPEQQQVYEKELWQIAAGIYVMDAVAKPNYKLLEGKKLTFALYLVKESAPELKATIAITAKSLEVVKVLLDRRRLAYIKDSRAQVMNFTTEYYQLNLEQDL